MLRHLGYVAINLTLSDAGFRTCRLSNATPDRLRDLIAVNLASLEKIIRFNAEHNILLYRISSQIIPFASHPVNTLAWWQEFGERLERIGALAHRHGIRVSMHPGQYTVLNSPRPDVVAAAIEDLEWHCRFLDALNVDRASKVNIHVGGIYGDKQAAIDRFVVVATALPESIRNRLTVENDDRSYTAEDTVEAATRAGLPVIFDWLHHHANNAGTLNTTAIMQRCFDTWNEPDGPPKTHYSTQAAGQRSGAHAEYVDAADFTAFLDAAPNAAFDCMLEAKGKDRALFRLREDLKLRPSFNS